MRKLNFGCGIDIKKGYDNVDILKDKGIDLSFDFNKFPYPIKDNTYNYVYCKNVLEHIKEPKNVLNELWRICKPNTEIKIIVPHYSNRSAYDEFEHCHYYSEIAFKYNFNKLDYTSAGQSNKFTILELKVIPSNIGKWIKPYWLREKLSLFLNGIQSAIYCNLKVIK